MLVQGRVLSSAVHVVVPRVLDVEAVDDVADLLPLLRGQNARERFAGSLGFVPASGLEAASPGVRCALSLCLLEGDIDRFERVGAPGLHHQEELSQCLPPFTSGRGGACPAPASRPGGDEPFGERLGPPGITTLGVREPANCPDHAGVRLLDDGVPAEQRLPVVVDVPVLGEGAGLRSAVLRALRRIQPVQGGAGLGERQQGGVEVFVLGTAVAARL
ncbi:hypothetical protein [Streptomyces sp. NPDC005548]|uniref:hypothetical protein n=1 Tax=Streptomyces sp. NPDC005548 TaxID=3364724 RepID=UPI00369B6C6E